ncbi:MAG: hypothetical protein ACJ741_19800 [Pyrinomonadaceae bacterium]
MNLRLSDFRPLILLAIVALVFTSQSALSQRVPPKSGGVTKDFHGDWEWAFYAKSRDELPPAYKGMSIKDVPVTILTLSLKQRGNRLRGTCNAAARYLARIEDTDFDRTIRGSTARAELQSGFGGKVTVSITLSGGGLYWKIVKSEGEHYFPDGVILRRKRRKRG